MTLPKLRQHSVWFFKSILGSQWCQQLTFCPQQSWRWSQECVYFLGHISTISTIKIEITYMTVFCAIFSIAHEENCRFGWVTWTICTVSNYVIWGNKNKCNLQPPPSWVMWQRKRDTWNRGNCIDPTRVSVIIVPVFIWSSSVLVITNSNGNVYQINYS